MKKFMNDDITNEIGEYPDPQMVDLLVIKVDLTPNDFYNDVIDTYVYEANRISNMVQTNPGVDYISLEILTKYFNTIIGMRVDFCNNKIDPAYARQSRYLFVPCFLHAMIDLIGEVIDETFGVKLIPEVKFNKEEILPIDELLFVSKQLLRLQDKGLKGVVGMPRDKVGVIDFMALTVMNNDQGATRKIASYRPGCKQLAIFGAVYQRLAMGVAVGLLPRVTYGLGGLYETDIKRVIARVT